MKMIWHIMKKDLRAIWPLWLAWLGLIAIRIPLILYYLNSASEQALSLMSLVSGCAFLADAILIFSLVRSLVHEDTLAGDGSFWITRPIAGTQLLFAKLASALLVCVVSPLVVLVPTWWGFGFDGTEVAHVLTSYGQINSGLLVLAFLFAIVTRRGSSFWLVLISTVVAFMILGLASSMWLSMSVSFYERQILVYSGVVLVLFVVVQQFIKRRTWIAQSSLGVGALLTALVSPHCPRIDTSLSYEKRIDQPLTTTWNGVGAYFAKKDQESSLPDYVKGKLEIVIPKEYTRVELQLLKGEWIDSKGAVFQADGVDDQGNLLEAPAPAVSSPMQKDGQGAFTCDVPLTLSANWLWNKAQPWTPTGFFGRFRIMFIQTVTVADLKLVAGAKARTGSFVTRLVSVQSYKDAVKFTTIEAAAAGSGNDHVSLFAPSGGRLTQPRGSWYKRSIPMLWVRLEYDTSVYSLRSQEADGSKETTGRVDDSEELLAGGETHENLGERGWRFVKQVDQRVGYNDYDLKATNLNIVKASTP